MEGDHAKYNENTHDIPLAAVRNACTRIAPDYRWSKDALELIRTQTESHMTTQFTHAARIAEHAGRKGVRKEDLQLATQFSHHS